MSDNPTVWNSLRRALTPMRAQPPAGAHGADLAGLPPLSREILEDLPDPLMLVGKDGRVLFANNPMRTVIGTDPHNKRVTSLLRTPALLEAIERTAETGDTSSIEFTIPVPVERQYSAH